MIQDQEDIALMMLEGTREPVSLSFDEAFNHPDMNSRKKGRKAIYQEFNEMNLREVWKIICKSEDPIVSRATGCLKSSEAVCIAPDW